MGICSLMDMSAVSSMITAFLSDQRISWAIIFSMSFKMPWKTQLYLVRQCHDINPGISLARSSRSCLKLLCASSWPHIAKPWHAKYSDEENIIRSAFLASFISFCFPLSQVEAPFHTSFHSCCKLKAARCKFEASRLWNLSRAFFQLENSLFYERQARVFVPGSIWKKDIHLASSVTGSTELLVHYRVIDKPFVSIIPAGIIA